MDQVDELLVLIAAHKEIGVIGASVMFSFLKRRIQPIQQCHTLGFEYMGAEDPSRICVEELTDDAALIQVKRVLLAVNTMPYIPELFSAQNPPEPVRFRLLEKISIVLELPLKILYRDTRHCTGVIRHKPTSPNHTTFFPAPPLKQKGLNRLTICPAARHLKVRSP
jgi:hypothetical protein